MLTLVFDLDGTLVDSAEDLAAAASELVESLGGPPLDVATVIPMVGDGASVLVQRALVRAGLDPKTPGALDRFLAIYDRRLLDHTRPYEGIAEVLAMVMHLGPLAVLTNKPAQPTLTLLEALGLRGFFSAVIGGDSPHGRKPDPAGLRSLLAHTGGAGVMIGDSPADAQTAEAAPCPFILAGWGFGVAKFDGGGDGGSDGGTEVPPLHVPPLQVPRVRAGHPRELVSLVDTRTFDAARMPIVMR